MSTGIGPVGEVEAFIDFVDESYCDHGLVYVRERSSSSGEAVELVAQVLDNEDAEHRCNIIMTIDDAAELADLLLQHVPNARS